MTRTLPAWMTPTQVRALGLAPVAPRAAPPALDVDEAIDPVAATKRKRRAEMRKRWQRYLVAAKLCINAPSHGKATHGVRCKACAEKHGGYSGRKAKCTERYARWQAMRDRGMTVAQVACAVGYSQDHVYSHTRKRRSNGSK